jgi:hypothetical protein
MSSSSKRRQTMAKLTRERMVKERRALKQERKQEKKEAARSADAPAGESSEHAVDGDTSGG